MPVVGNMMDLVSTILLFLLVLPLARATPTTSGAMHVFEGSPTTALPNTSTPTLPTVRRRIAPSEAVNFIGYVPVSPFSCLYPPDQSDQAPS